MKSFSVNIQMKATNQYFPMVLFIFRYFANHETWGIFANVHFGLF